MRNLHVATAVILLVMAGVVGASWLAHRAMSHASGAPGPKTPVAANAASRDDIAFKLLTAHYEITSTATRDETREVAATVEALRDAWFDFFDDARTDPSGLMPLRLYGSRDEFKRNNRSRPWAEAYYLPPTCHAYFARRTENPHHWMLHEATHQLNDVGLGLRGPRWINEGLAAYFGASRLVDGRLQRGDADVHAYPIWWLDGIGYSGDLAADIAAKRVVPLRALITGEGADINETLNPHYVGFWSLTHFLIHHRDGTYLPKYRQLIREGGSLEAFERLIGPLHEIQPEWYEYLMQQVSRAGHVPEPMQGAPGMVAP